MATVEMSFTPLPVHVRTARLVATAVARRSGVQEALLDEVRLAVGEACSRAVEAHRAHCPTEPVRIELTGTRGRFEVVVTDAAAREEDGARDHGASDHGNPDHEAHDHEVGDPAGLEAANGLPAPGGGPGNGYPATDSSLDDPEALLPQGLGLAVIAGLADDVKISRTAAGLSIRMSWPSGDYAG